MAPRNSLALALRTRAQRQYFLRRIWRTFGQAYSQGILRVEDLRKLGREGFLSKRHGEQVATSETKQCAPISWSAK